MEAFLKGRAESWFNCCLPTGQTQGTGLSQNIWSTVVVGTAAAVVPTSSCVRFSRVDCVIWGGGACRRSWCVWLRAALLRSGEGLMNRYRRARVALLVNGFCYKISYVWARLTLLVNGFCYRISHVWAKVAFMERGLGPLNPYVRAIERSWGMASD